METPNFLPYTDESEAKTNRRISPIAACAAVILCASLICHGWLIARLISKVPAENLSRILTSQLIPNYTFAEREILLQYYDAEPLPQKITDQNGESIQPQDISAVGENAFQLANQTSYSPDLAALADLPSPIEKKDRLYERYLEGEPLVVIYHTHATESFRDTNDSGSFRSENEARNMISVGEVMCRALEMMGIPSVHIKEPFDLNSYNDAYYNSSNAVADFLRDHPSVQYVIDLHRDCIMTSDGKYVAPTYTDENGMSFAQLMFVVGTDEGGSGHTKWKENLTVALHLQSAMSSSYSDLMRPINLRSPSFYQHTSPGAMLLEMGACGNTLTEAKRSAVLFAHALSEYIHGYKLEIDPYTIIEEIC